MKLNLQYRIALLFLLIPVISLANVGKTLIKTTEEKRIKKMFNVAPDVTLNVNNSYGSVDVITWENNRIEFDILIKVTGNDSEKIQDKLDEITVVFSASTDVITAITKIRETKSSWWIWGKNNNLQLNIKYVIKMPISGNVDLTQDYGSINLDRLDGVAKISCDYGKITTKELMADHNDIRFDYSSNCYFEYIKSGKITADYSGFTVAKTKDLNIKADYTKSIVEVAENVSYNCDYGSLKIDNINNFSGNGDYLALRLGNVFKNVELKANYGSVKIDRMASKANNIDINADFTGITIGHDSAYNFDFNIALEYASLRESDGFNFTNKEIDHTEKKYEGYHGSKNSGNLIKINSEYGSVTFKKN
ncbi:hypothetical protein [Winogradskyella bathintestinalis]|uniref:Adhesin domain-containing protein n=1 Tax=Winogradskyella bathintestinalis TaxID=3035208 RepID=A0ABT7ZSV5_9FLAO|nr:hypothetical protein [Winogradskyella bathintestinalis]MDN3492102.1 hypothetical protein [Winogradskyella bathintestinalis]